MSERARIQLCGRLSVLIDGREVVDRLRGRQVPLLFAYLVLHRERAIGRDELPEAMWPDSAPRSQDAALRTLLSRLRSGLGAGVLVGRDELALELPQPAWIDVEAASAELPRAQEALQRGDARAAWALAQVPLNIAARGLLPGVRAPWLESPRRELAELRLQALEVIGRAGLALGGNQLGSVERAGRALLELEPYRESGYVLLMEALAAQGNAAEALRVYERLRALLRDELGTAPSREALAVHERLLGAPAAASRRTRGPVASDGDGPAPSIELPAPLSARATSPLIGRRAELRTMRAWWAQGPDHPERTLLLAGEAGMGKSRLLAALAAEAHADGAVVLAGRAQEETLVPYQPFLEAIGHFAFHASGERLRAAVERAGDAGPDIARLVPEIRRRLPDLPPPRPGDPETDRYRLFEAVAGLLGELAAGGPLLIVLDDLHWGGRPTMLLVRHLTRSPQAAGLRIAGGYRLGEPDSEELAALAAALRRDGLVRQLALGGLPPADAGELVRRRVGVTPSAALQDALYSESEGNPFFLEELARHLVDAGLSPSAAGLSELRRVGLPDDVRDLINRRLERLGESALEWLRGAAVIGRDFDASLLEAVLGFEEDRFLDALEEALQARLVVESPGVPGHFTFSHALVRETLYAGISSARRARIHHRVGLVLEQRTEARAIGALAHHFTLSDRPEDGERAIRYGLAAGERATAMFANEEAAEHYARALGVLERIAPEDRGRRCALLLALGEARVRAGERAAAGPVLREAARLADELDDRDTLVRAVIGASHRFILPPGVIDDELVGLLERARELTAGHRTVQRVRVLSRLGGALYFSPRREEMRRLSAEATSIADELGDPTAAALAASARRRAWWSPDQLARRLTDATMVLRHAIEADDAELTLYGHAWLIVDLLESGDRAGVEAQRDAYEVEANALGQPLFLWSARVWQAMLALLDGRLADAERLAEEALEIGIRPEPVAARRYHLLQMLAIRREQGRAGELEPRVRELGDEAARLIWRAGAALLLCDIGETDRARAAFASLVGPDVAELPLDGDWLSVMAVLAEVALALRDTERGALILERLAPYAESMVVFGVGAFCWGSVARPLGRLALLVGERERAVALLRDAVAADERLRAPVLTAHARLDLARALGPGAEAEELVRAAAGVAEEHELGLVAQRVAQARAALARDAAAPGAP